MNPRPRYEALDSLRFLAAAVVVIAHARQLSPSIGIWPDVVQRLLDARGAVTFFFVLSGFVLHPVWRDGAPSARGYAAFMLRRWFRVMPLYLFSLLLAWLVISLLPLKACPWLMREPASLVLAHSPHDLRQWMAHLLMFDPALDTSFLNPPIWTLVVEMKVALIFPLLSWVVRRARGVMTVVLLLITTVIAPWLVTHVTHSGFAIAHFMLGAMLAERRERGNIPGHAWLWLALGLMLYVSPFPPGRLVMYHFNVVAVGAVMVMHAVLSDRWLRAMLEMRWLVVGGQASYGLYVLHFPVLLATAWTAWRMQWPADVVASATMVIAIALAIALRSVVELPGIALGRRLAGMIKR